MKHLITLLMVLLCNLAVWADNVEIPLDSTQNPSGQAGNVEKDKRSLSFAPTASHDGNTVYIYSSIPSEEIQITVLDEVGNVVYENEVVGSYVFTLSGSIAGKLTLVLETKEGIYQGNFNVE